MNTLATQDPAELMANVLIKGDIAGLSEQDKHQYYNSVCSSLGLNPLTKPFDYIKLNGKLTLYAKRDCADQLRAIHGVSIKVISKEEIEGVYIVSVAAQNKHGRQDEDTGAVSIAGLRGEARANAILKAITKAKRRVTLSICGLGMLDETETSDIPGHKNLKFELDEKFGKVPEKDPQISSRSNEKELPSATPSKTVTANVEANLERPEAFLLILGDDAPIEYTSSLEWVTEYRKQQNFIGGNKEVLPQDRMSALHNLEKDNHQALGLIPESEVKKLHERRLTVNKKLGAQK